MTSNICRANFNGGRTAQGNNRYQWDYGQILEISGIENLPDPFTAQFSNYPVLGTAKTTVGTGGRVEIPNEYFVSGQNIYCFIVLHTDEDDGRTVYIATIPVTKRPKPIDDPITPTQQSTIDTAIAALQVGVSRAEGFAQTATEQAGIATEAATTATEAAARAEGAVADVEAAATRAETAAEGAGASATAAETSATDAESAKTAALTAKGAAETAAANAEQSATDAGNYAGLAEGAETSAATSATAAEASATAAAGSASAASGSASQAAQKASEASASATAAETSATNAEAAQTSAWTAQTAAEAAQASAEEAAANAEQSATTAEWYAERVERFLPTDTASGEIASFPDGADSVPMQSVVVSMEPIQDLHGYDHPWPAGGGKNLLPISLSWAKANNTYGTWDGNSYTFRGIKWTLETDDADNVKSIVANGTATQETGLYFGDTVAIDGDYILSGCPTGGNGTSTFNLRIMKTDGSVATSDYGNSATVSMTDTVQGRITIYGGYTANNLTFKPMLRLSSVTDSTFAPYSNLCPISGRTGADIEHTGVNVWDEEWENGRIHATTGENISGNGIRSNFIPVVPSTTYYALRGDYTGASSITLYYYDAEKRFISYENKFGFGTVFTTPSSAWYLRFNIMTSAAVTTYNHDISINYPATDTSYHAYQGDTISVTFPSETGTVYGGTLNVTTGELVVDRAMVDMGTLNWTFYNYSGNPGGYSYSIRDTTKKYDAYENANAVCTALSVLSDNDFNYQNTGANFAINSGGLIKVTTPNVTDAESLKAALSGVMLCYYLADPITYHLTPQEVRTLLGQNNIWSDAGEVTVTYKADVQLYIDKRISALS